MTERREQDALERGWVAFRVHDGAREQTGVCAVARVSLKRAETPRHFAGDGILAEAKREMDAQPEQSLPLFRRVR